VPGAPSVNPEKLGSLRTLQQVADFVKGSAPAPLGSAPAAVPAADAGPAVNAKATLLSTVAELTGYPVESLALEMDLEADLGIDSIKRVEILSLLSRRIPGAPSVNPEKLSGLKTLEQVLAFIGSTVAEPAAVTPAPAPAAAPVADASAVLLSTVAELTGYPVETLALSMDLEADLGIDSIKRVEILSLLSRRIPNAPSVDPEKLAGLRTLEQVLAFVKGAAPVQLAPVATPVVAPSTVIQVAPAAAVQRRVVVPVRAKVSAAAVKWPAAPIFVTDEDAALAAALVKALTRAGQSAQVLHAGDARPLAVGGVVLTAPASTAWDEGAEARLAQTLRTMRDVSPALRSTPGAFVAAVSRRDGAFGFGGGASTAHPLSGALTGLVKTLALEWPEVRCRSLDVSPLWTTEDAAAVVVDELASEGPGELGLGPAGRVTLALRESSVAGGSLPLAPKDVVVVTGGARGVTADCAKALAQRCGATLVLLGRTPAPTAEPEWLAAAKDEAAIKRTLLERAPQGTRPSPKQLAESCRAVLAARDIRVTLESMARLGVTAEYRQVDVRDAGSVATVLAEVRASVGPIRGVVHGAGVLRDKRIEDKRDDDFEQVLDPKIAGLRAVLDATRGDDLTVLALFSSVSGRFGRKGQSDYALANQALVSIAQAEALRRPACRVVALDWGPWAGGMVTPALEATFKAEGIALIPLEAGARAFVDELMVDASGPREVVLGAGFGEAAEAGWSLVGAERIERSWPVLADHRLNGKPVLPFAMTLEWFTRAARALAEGRKGLELDDVRVLRGVTFDDDREELSIWAGRPERRGGEALAVPLELRNRKDVVHVRGVAVLHANVPDPERIEPVVKVGPFPTPVSELYASQLFHGPSLWAIRSIEALGEDGLQATFKTHATSERLVPGPSRPWAIDPLVLDGVFQALIVWSRARLGAPCLPSKVGALTWLAMPAPGDMKATIRVRAAEGATVVADVELVDSAQVRVAVLEGAEATVSSTLNRAFAADAPVVQPTPQA
jgi:NAD(P)-dependent dehydrogenase (short-subunit alcohol dehydrogenase family)/acyl carrier protein